MLLSDLDGAGSHPISTLAPVQAEAAAAAAAAAAACADPSPAAKAAAAAAAEAAVFAARLDTVAVPTRPSMATWAYAAPEMFVGQVLEQLQHKSLAVVAAEAKAAGLDGAVALLARLYRECPGGASSKAAQLAWLRGMNGGRDSMCGASHLYLFGASTTLAVSMMEATLQPQMQWLQQQEQKLRAQGAAEADVTAAAEAARLTGLGLGFLVELRAVMRPLMAAAPEARPSLRQVRAALAQLQVDWC